MKIDLDTSSPTCSQVDVVAEGIRERLQVVQGRISELSDGRPVLILCVTKGFPAYVTEAAYRAGVRAIGENYVQELSDKFRSTRDLEGLRRHFIGHMQSNKAKSLSTMADVIETISRTSELDRLGKIGFEGDLFLQVKFDRDPGRNGAELSEVPGLKRYGDDLGLKISGLMTVAPVEDPANRLRVFRMLKDLCDEHALQHCSMGMSDDFELAVMAGATEVRLGSALLGHRPNFNPNVTS